MAVLHFFRTGQFEQSVVQLYSVEEDVGFRRAPNKRHDVMLVQFFLNDLFGGSGLPGPKLAIDGIFGPTTYLWMLYCLNYMVDKHGLRYLYRGMLTMDAAAWAPKLDQISTFAEAGMIGYMNEDVHRRSQNRHKNLLHDNWMPDELKKALIHRYTSDVQARILKGEI